jgi:hypothetical protein
MMYDYSRTSYLSEGKIMEGWQGGVRVYVTGGVGSMWTIISSDNPYPTDMSGVITDEGGMHVIVPEEWFPIHIDTSFGTYGAFKPGLPQVWANGYLSEGKI